MWRDDQLVALFTCGVGSEDLFCAAVGDVEDVDAAAGREGLGDARSG